MNIVSQVLVEAMSGLKIGVGNAVLDLVSLAQSHREAEEALTVGLALANHDHIYHFSDLGFLHWLYQIPPEDCYSNPFMQRLKILDTQSRAIRAQLLSTL